jgi:hypothetical protein
MLVIYGTNGDTFNKQLLNFSEKYQIKKEKTKIKVAEWRKNQEDKENVTGYTQECNDAKVKESKVKESKVNNVRVSAKKAEMDFIDQIIQLFIQAHGDYIIVNNGEERKMAAKILTIYKNKYPGATSEETLEALKQFFINCMDISDPWLKTNMSLPIIVSKFNQITKILKNGNSKKSGATYADIARVTRQNFPEQFIKE